MDRMRGETLEMPALGQPFQLGMLYDCRADKLIPGFMLWDYEKLEQDTVEIPKPNNEFDIVASESISDKFLSLGVESSLKLSFLSGLIKVNGSAKYLNDNKTSEQQARVTLKYKTTTKFKQLTMNQLGRGNIKHPHVFEQGLATHVVTAILYSAQAFFVFDQEVSDAENFEDIQENLLMMVKKIPSISIGGERALNIDKDKDKVNKFSCKFHGDISPSQSPVTFEDAVKVYQDLPKQLGPDGEKAVPVKVWLLPLTFLEPTAAKLVRQISVGLVFQIERTLEDFEDLEMRCHDVLKTAALKQFSHIARKIKMFMKYCSEFKLGLQGILAKKLPSIRGGGEDEADLAEIFKKIPVSPFSSECLNHWISCKVKEINMIKTTAKCSEILSSHTELDDRVCNTKNAVCFVFTSLESDELYLAALDQYLESFQSDKPSLRAKDTERDQWFSSKSVQETVRLRAKLFTDFAETNQKNEDVKFLAVCFEDQTHKDASIHFYKDGGKISDNFEPPSKPERLNVEDITHDSVSLSFCAVISGGEVVTGYRMESCQSGGDWQYQTEAKAGTVTVTGLSPDTEYSFRVRAVTDVGLGPAAEVKSIKTSLEPEGPVRLTEELRKSCELIETKGSLQIFKAPLQKDELHIPGCARFIYGKDSVKRNCTIMVMGATGAGKSTLINGMINYILGVQWTDPYRFKLVVEEAKCQSQSQTSEVTVYKINYDDGFMIDYSLTIIDTPGFGDTRGIVRDREITEQIRTLFSSNFGVNDIHAICFVAQSSLARVTATQRYVFDSVLSIFGNDVAENIRILVTFADGQPPPVLQAINAARVPCPKTDDGQPAHYKFNNSALFAENQTSAVGFDEMFWNMGKASMKDFFDALDNTEPKSLTLTKEVLQERQRLEEAVEDIERKLKEGLAKADEINQTEDQLKKHESEIERNRDFEITVSVIKPFQVDISGTGKYITNCQICHFTCHFPCTIANDADKKNCWAMGWNRKCKKCPGKCIWSAHYNQKYRWEYKEVTEKKTVEELKDNYLKGTKMKKTVEDLVLKLKAEYQSLHDSINAMVQEATRNINRLKKIALKQNPLTAPDYIDMLIESEKKHHQPGWKKRLRFFKKMKDKAVIMEIVGTGADPVTD